MSEVRGAAERRYPMPLSPRLGAADGRSYTTPPRPKTRASSQEEQPKTKARGSDKRDYPELWLCGHRRAYRSYPTLKVRKGGGEEIPLIQGKEQWLCFVGAAVKRYPTPKVRETQVRR